ncbi:CPBP family intramembrane glutamic endopeptidase [Maricaulis sp. CAU 1757]
MTSLSNIRTKTDRFGSPWRFWHGLLILALAMAAYTALSIGHFQLVERTVGVEAYLGSGDRLPASVLLAGQLNKAVALVGVLVVAGLVLPRLPLSAVGLKAAAWRWIGLAVVMALAAFVLRLGLAKEMVAWVPGWLPLVQPPFALDGASGVVMATGFLVMTVVITPLAEEVFYRGFLFRWMSAYRGVRLAALISSMMFAVMHVVPPQVISAFGLALVLCWLYWRTGSIWPAIVAHMVNNALGIGLGAAALAGRLPAWLTP